MPHAALLTLGLLLSLFPAMLVAVAGLEGTTGDWLAHLWQTVLPTYALVSARVALGAAAMALFLGGIPAWLIHNHNFPLRRLATLITLLPITFPAFVLAGIYDEVALPTLLGTEGTLILSLGSTSSPYVFLLLRVAMARIPASFRDAACALGCRARDRFFHLHLPLLALPLTAGAFLAAADALSDYGAAERLGVGTFTIGLYNLWVGLARNDVAALLALLLLGLSLPPAVLWVVRLLRTPTQSPSVGTPRRRATRPLGTLFLSCCLVLAMPGFFVPMGFTLVWASQKINRIPLTTLYGDIGNTVLTTLATVAVVSLAALAVVTVARTGRQMALAEKALWLSLGNYLLPPLVLAFAFLSFTAERSPIGGLVAPLRESRLLLVLAEALRFLPLMLLPLLDALARTSPHIVESARSLGHGPISARFGALLPTLWPTLAAGASLVAIESIKELTLSLSLQPFGYSALALRVFGFANIHLARDASVWVLAMQIVMFYPVWRLWGFIERDEGPNA